MNDLKHLKNVLNDNVENVLSKLGIEHENLGENIYSVCPIHHDGDNPRAFCFSKAKGIWKCWTRDCQNDYRNDIFGLIQGALSSKLGREISFKEVLGWSYKHLNIKKVHSTVDTQENQNNDWHNVVNIIANKESDTKQNNIISFDEPTICPSAYFLSRGYDAKTLTHFGVGDCMNKDSPLYNRAIVPIHNPDGQLVALIARSIKEYKDPKFLLYPKGVNKSFLLYNHHRALQSIQETNTVFLVEGQGDVWRLYEAGIINAVGIFGKTISKEQENKINSMPITHIVVLTDNDQAGREAKMQIQRQFGRLYRLSFPTFKKKDIGEMSAEEIKNDVLIQIRGSY